MPLSANRPAPSSVRIDKTDPDVTYFGWAVTGADEADPVWRIARLDSTSEPRTYLWADGNAAYDNVWDSRTGLSYY